MIDIESLSCWPLPVVMTLHLHKACGCSVRALAFVPGVYSCRFCNSLVAEEATIRHQSPFNFTSQTCAS